MVASKVSPTLVPCACGCGTKITTPNPRGKPRRFVNGHQSGAPLRTRLLSKLIVDPTGCLLWTGETLPKGYGVISVKNRGRYVHRVMWEMFEGPIPPGLTLDHVWANGCANRNCASIAHLEPVTSGVNTLRGNSPSAINAAKTHCDYGHEFTPQNTRITAQGARECKTCHRDKTREARAAALSADPSRIPHGTLGGYSNWRCRCELCTTTERDYRAALYARKQQAAGAAA